MAAAPVALPDGFALDTPAPNAAAPAGLPDGFALDQPSVAADVAKSGGIGLVHGAIGMIGTGGDARDLSIAAARKVAELAGASPGAIDTGSKIANTVMGVIPGFAGAGSGAIQSAAEKVTGPFYKPQTTAGHFAETAGEFAPAALGGEGSIGARVARNVVLPAVASETAGQATQGTAAEPYARVGGALIGGGVGSALDRVGAARAAAAATPTIEDVRGAATAGYRHPDITAVQIRPQAMENLSDSITANLNRQRINDRLAPQTHALLDELDTPVNGQVHTIEDLETTRQRLGDLAGNFNNPVEQGAATQAMRALDTYSANIPQSHLIAGDADAANRALTTARANYASQATAQRVQDKLNNADLRAASTYSGGNLNNATRQNLRTLLTSKTGSRGLTADELQTIEDTVRGSTTGNMLRAGGKFLGGGGGLGMLGSSAAGHAVAGPLGAIAAPAIGFGVKKVGDAITRANAAAIVRQILQRSPLGASQAAQVPAYAPDRLAMLKRLLLANSATIPARLQMSPALANPQ